MSGTTDRIRGLANQAAGRIKQGFGRLTGNTRLHVEGSAQKMKGHGQETVGNVKNAVKGAANRHL